jgi:hypothetical protein
MWRLDRASDHAGGSATVLSSWNESRARRWARRLRQHAAQRRRERARRRITMDEPVGDLVIAALGPTVAKHGIGAVPDHQTDSVIWCSGARDVPVIGGDPWYLADPMACTDLWVHVDQHAQTIGVQLESHDLADFVTGASRVDDAAASVDLADDLDRALAMLAEHLDRFCAATIVRG